METERHVLQQSASGSLRDILTVFFKHRGKITAIFLVIVAAVAAITFLLPPLYEAQSTVLVKFGREYVYRPEVLDKAPVVSVNQEEAINSEINIITSRDLLEKVITSMGVATLYPELLQKTASGAIPIESAITEFSRDLDVEVIKKSNVLRVTFRHKDPVVAARAVNLLVDLFKERHLQVYNGPESVFLRNQLSAYEQKLRETESRVQRFKQNNGVYSLDEQRALLLKQRTELDGALKSSRSHIEASRERLSSLDSQMKQIGGQKRYTQSERDRIIVEAKAQLLNRQFKERELLEKYPEDSRLVQNVRKEIALVTSFLKQQEEDITSKVSSGNVVYQEAEKGALVAQADLNAEVAREKRMRQQLGQLDAEISSLDLKERELEALKRDLSTNDRNYRTYLDRYEEARIASDRNRQQLTNLSVIQSARPPVKPVKPKKALNIVVGIVLGTVSGLGYAVLCELAAQGLSNPEAARNRLAMPVLATIDLRK